MKKAKFVYLFLFALAFNTFPEVQLSQAERASVRNDDVEIFVTSWCPYCRALEKYLQANHIPYSRRDIEHDVGAREKYLGFGGGGFPLVRIGSTLISGFDEDQIDDALRSRSRELKSCNYTC